MNPTAEAPTTTNTKAANAIFFSKPLFSFAETAFVFFSATRVAFTSGPGAVSVFSRSLRSCPAFSILVPGSPSRQREMISSQIGSNPYWEGGSKFTRVSFREATVSGLLPVRHSSSITPMEKMSLRRLPVPLAICSGEA
jgi:hypothetical protein